MRLYTPAMPARSHLLLLGVLLSGLVLGTPHHVLAQVSGRAATPAGPIGASMAVLAVLQDANVLPPEETPEANRVIKLVIQFQSTFMKSPDPALLKFLSQALATQDERSATDTLSRFRAGGWTAEVLDALHREWVATATDQRALLAPGFRQFNVSLDDFDRLMELVGNAQAALQQQGKTMHQVFTQRRREMPGGAP